MLSSLFDKWVPGNLNGKPTDLENTKTFNSKSEAQEAFKRAYKRMLNVTIWHKLIGFASAHFVLRDTLGRRSNRLAEVGDYFQIDIPGPGPSSGDGYDWVVVEAIKDNRRPEAEEEAYGMRLRSTKNPNKTGDEVAHFFTSEATSTFIVSRYQNTVSCSYHGRNEVINTETEKIKDKIRNTIVGAGAMLGISELQWSALIKSFLEREV